MYKPTPTVEQGGQVRAVTQDSAVQDLLREILVELRIQNRHLSLMTDEEIKEPDIGET